MAGGSFTVGPGGRFALPWQRAGGVLPLSRGMSSGQVRPRFGLPRDEYRLEHIDNPRTPPHYHVRRCHAPANLNELRPYGHIPELGRGSQALTATVPRGLLSCEAIDCQWFLHGKEGIDEGKPFRHPQGVECGDEVRCTDDNCPCPQRVVEWPGGIAAGHIAPCAYCNGRYRVTLPGQGAQPQLLSGGLDEYFYRLDEGADALVQLLTRGV